MWQSLAGGEIELPGEMYRNLPCPIVVWRDNGGGLNLPGQRVGLKNVSASVIEALVCGLDFPGIPGAPQGTAVSLQPGTEWLWAPAAMATGWTIRIDYWADDPRTKREAEFRQAQRMAFGGGDGPADNAANPNAYRLGSQSAPRVSSPKPTTPATNPLDAARQQRRLL